MQEQVMQSSHESPIAATTSELAVAESARRIAEHFGFGGPASTDCV